MKRYCQRMRGKNRGIKETWFWKIITLNGLIGSWTVNFQDVLLSLSFCVSFCFTGNVCIIIMSLSFVVKSNFRYAMYLFSKQHDDLVGVYASQLACHLCIDLFVQMMELRVNDR